MKQAKRKVCFRKKNSLKITKKNNVDVKDKPYTTQSNCILPTKKPEHKF